MDSSLPITPHRTPKKQQRLLVFMAVLVASTALVAAGMVALYFWQANQKPPLPTAITHAITGYTPYFYPGTIPAGYSLSPQNISLEKGVLILPLVKAGKPGLSITQQALSDSFSFEELQKYGIKVEGAAAQAIINDVEGRLVGIMPVQQTKTLILFTAEPGMDKDELANLIKGLKPLR